MGSRLARAGALMFTVLGLLSLTAPSALGVTAKAPPVVPNGFVGMNLDAPVFPNPSPGIDLPAQFSRMEATGVETVRAVFDWSYAQPYRSWADVPADETSQFVNVGGIPTRFAESDELVADAAAEGMTVLPVVLYAPAWDSTGATVKGFGRPARTAPYGAYLTALVRRYGPNGSFWAGHAHPKPITQWQIWNEPDLSAYWPTQPFAKTYVALLHAAHVAIKRADASAQVVTAGLTNYSWRDLASIYRVAGARSDFDAVAVHPYTEKPAGVVEIIHLVRSVMDKNHDGAKPIIASEISWTSAGENQGSGADIGTTEQGQARNIAALLPMLARDRQSLGLRAFYWYTWASQEMSDGDTFGYAGLLRYADDSLQTKPAYGAFRSAALAIEHCQTKGATATVCAKR